MTGAAWWRDAEAPWWIKMVRARKHIDEVSADIAWLREMNSGIEAVPGVREGETDYRLRLPSPVPMGLSAAVGDALHNMRSALDCAAFALAERHVDRTLKEREERACQFPIFGDLTQLDGFLATSPRDVLYGPREREAFRSVQPGWLHDLVLAHDGTEHRPRQEEVAHDDLTLLNRLSNIDKHRRLHLVVWWPGLVYWGSNGPSQCQWRWGSRPSQTAPSWAP